MIQKPLFSEEEIQKTISNIADQINRDYAFENELYMIGVLKGACIFFADLVRKIKRPLRLDFVRVKTYEDMKAAHLPQTLLSEKSLDAYKGKNVLLIEDIIDKGKTARFLLDEFSKHKPKSLKICSLLYKTTAFDEIEKIDYPGLLVNRDAFVIGYGLDFNELYRELPRIDTLEL